MVDLDSYYNIFALFVNGMFKYTINGIRIDPRWAHHLIRWSINDRSMVGRAKNTHLIIYNREVNNGKE